MAWQNVSTISRWVCDDYFSIVSHVRDDFTYSEYETQVTQALTSRQAPFSPFIKINVIISRGGFSKLWISNLKDSPRILTLKGELPLVETSLTIDFSLFQCYQQTFSLFKEITQILDDDEALKCLVDEVFERVEEEVKSMPANHNHVTLQACVSGTTNFVIVRKVREIIAPQSPAIKSLVTIENMSSESSCGICLEGYSNPPVGAMMPCKHVFHRPCIVKWLTMLATTTRSCPICRYHHTMSLSPHE